VKKIPNGTRVRIIEVGPWYGFEGTTEVIDVAPDGTALYKIHIDPRETRPHAPYAINHDEYLEIVKEGA
jgi:hypothetical protein